MSINATLFVQAVVFLLLVLFTMKFVWPPIAKALDERAQKVAAGLAAAEKAKAELSSANQRVEQELAASRNETAGRLADAERRAQQIIDEAKSRASEEAAKIVAAARDEAEHQVDDQLVRVDGRALDGERGQSGHASSLVVRGRCYPPSDPAPVAASGPPSGASSGVLGGCAGAPGGPTSAVAPSIRTTLTAAPTGNVHPGSALRADHSSPASLTRPDR